MGLFADDAAPWFERRRGFEVGLCLSAVMAIIKILFVADGRSPIALNWIRYFIASGHQVHLVSTFACMPEPGLASLEVIPVAFSEIRDAIGSRAEGLGTVLRSMIPVGIRTGARRWLAPLTLPRAARRLREVVEKVKPDLVHAMRIPYEGMIASLALADPGRSPKPPLLVSVWGNDFTLHAASTFWMKSYTRFTLRRADALHTDCRRDQRLAWEWGFDQQKPFIVLPGGGGVQQGIFYPPQTKPLDFSVINPRGFRAYVRNDTFFRSIPLVLDVQPKVRFLCPAMAGEPKAQRWVFELGIAHAVNLLPYLSPSQMANLYRQSQVTVSLTTHDGTPNTLLEALACGCFPIVGDIESLREWITPEVNGLLVNPEDPQALARAILHALQRPELREQARQINLSLVQTRAEYFAVMQEVQAFYQSLLRF